PGALELIERGRDCSALGVPKHDDQRRAEPLRSEFDAPDLRGGDDVTGDPDDEEISEPLVEDDFGGDPRVGAAENDRERLLIIDDGIAATFAGEGVTTPDALAEATIPV